MTTELKLTNPQGELDLDYFLQFCGWVVIFTTTELHTYKPGSPQV